jgi:hypothetical protein
MDAGDGFSLALKSDQTLWAWGRNSHGQLGLGNTADRLTPTQVTGVTTAEAVAAGGQHALILLAGGAVLATGNNDFGQLGLGTTTSVSTPTAVPGLSGISAVSAGYFHSAAFGSSNQVSIWGRNFEGQCGGGGSSPVIYPSPQILAGLSGVPTGIDCGYHFTLVEFADGSVAGSGSNSDGQLDGSSLADQDDSRNVLAPQATPLAPDLSPPLPNPMSFSSGPAAVTATSVTMTATTASDPSGPVEYFFDCTTPGGHDSEWQTDATYVDTGLTTGISYIYQVKARDAIGNETTFSDTAAAIPEADTTAPQIASLSPDNGASGVAVDTPLVLTLNEDLLKGSGSIRIRESLANGIVTTINMSTVTVDTAEVRIELPADLADGTAYYVELDAGVVTDLSGNSFQGIEGSTTWSFTTAVATVSTASLLAHYTFDTDNVGSTPDSVGSNSATLGNRVQINTAVAGRIGSGALEILGAGSTSGPGDGALTSNSFLWASDARTIVFWWKAKTPNVNTDGGAYVSFGDASGNGTRFEAREQGGTSLRVEVQGAGENTNPAGFDDGNWHFVALTVPENASLEDVAWYVDGGANLNTSTATQAIATGTGPIAFGDSILTAGPDDRVPNGFLDDFQLYDEVLGPSQLEFLRENPGSVIEAPNANFDTYISDPAFGIGPGERGFDQDPDGDQLGNGLETWLGTHPGQPSAGLANLATDGITTTFTHPQNEARPVDVSGFYEWSPNLIDWYAGDGVDGPPDGAKVVFSRSTDGAVTTVAAINEGSTPRLFFRVGARQQP